MTQLVQFHQDGPVSRITLNRPDESNLVNVEMMRGLVDALESATESGSLVVTVGSEGADFSIGRDQV